MRAPPDQGPDCGDVALSIWSAKSGRCYHEFLVPHDQNSDGKDLPFGWDLDFSKCPIHFQPKRSLERWIAVRGRSRRRRHDNLHAIIEGMMNEPAVQVLTEAEASILLPKTTRYTGMEILIPSSQNAKWVKDDLANLRKVCFSDA